MSFTGRTRAQGLLAIKEMNLDIDVAQIKWRIQIS
jgi:hypothetical protein